MIDIRVVQQLIIEENRRVAQRDGIMLAQGVQLDFRPETPFSLVPFIRIEQEKLRILVVIGPFPEVIPHPEGAVDNRLPGQTIDGMQQAGCSGQNENHAVPVVNNHFSLPYPLMNDNDIARLDGDVFFQMLPLEEFIIIKAEGLAALPLARPSPTPAHPAG